MSVSGGAQHGGIQTAVRGLAALGAVGAGWPYIGQLHANHGLDAQAFFESIYADPSIAVSHGSEVDQAVALSALAHLLAGWRYLASSSQVLVKANRNKAIHLAYYAELRAVMAMLGVYGIVVLNSKHVAFDDNRLVRTFDGGTHEVSAKALRSWSTRPDVLLRLSENLFWGGYSANEWATFANSQPQAQSSIAHWLSNWSVDLTALRRDSTARNIASYRADLTANSFNRLEDRDLTTILALCDLSHSVANGRVEPLDQILLWDMMESIRTQVLGMTENDFWGQIDQSINKYGSQVGQVKDSENLRATGISPLVSILSSARSQPNPAALPAEIIARAKLLLRLATLMVRSVALEADAITGNNDVRKLMLALSRQYWLHCGLGSIADIEDPPGNEADAADSLRQLIGSPAISSDQLYVDHASDFIQISSLERFAARAILL